MAFNGSHVSGRATGPPINVALGMEPVPDRPLFTSEITSLHERTANGRAYGWTTRDGDILLEIEFTDAAHGSILWHIVEGTCSQWIGASSDGSGTPGAVLLRNAAYRYPLSIDTPREWFDQTLAIAAFPDGAGPILACGELTVIPS